MAKLIRTYVAQLMDVIPASEEIEDNWSWRREYIEMEGTLFILESEYKHPGERFVYLLSEDGIYLTTSCGTCEFREDLMIFTTKHSIYTFQILGCKPSTEVT